MIISREKNFIFFCNGKTGTTSIEFALKKCGDKPREGKPLLKKHFTPSEAKHLIPIEQWESAFKFVFVRNPYDWFVSQWFHNFRTKYRPDTNNPILNTLLRAKKFRRGFKKKMGRRRHTLTSKTLFTADDVRFLHDFLTTHFYRSPQNNTSFQGRYIVDPENNQLVDFIGRYESLQEDFDYITNNIGVEVTLPLINSSSHLDYRSYFTEESANEVYNLWKKDFEILGYSKNLDDKQQTTAKTS